MIIKFFLATLFFPYCVLAMDGQAQKVATKEQKAEQMPQMPVTPENVEDLLLTADAVKAEFSPKQLAQIGEIYGPIIQKQCNNKPLAIIDFVKNLTYQKGSVRIKVARWFINDESCLVKHARVHLAWVVALNEDNQKRIDVLLDYVADATKDLFLCGSMVKHEDPANPGQYRYKTEDYGMWYKINDTVVDAMPTIPILFAPGDQRFLPDHRQYVALLYQWVSGIKAGKPLPTNELWQHAGQLRGLLDFSGIEFSVLPCFKALDKAKKTELNRRLLEIVRKEQISPADISQFESLIMQGADVDADFQGETAQRIIAARVKKIDAHELYMSKFAQFVDGTSACLEILNVLMAYYSTQKVEDCIAARAGNRTGVSFVKDVQLNFSRPRCITWHPAHEQRAPEIFFANGRGLLVDIQVRQPLHN